jgi:ribosomal protein S18 acetylase RimI-like enzyme
MVKLSGPEITARLSNGWPEQISGGERTEPGAITIREAGEADLPAILQLYAQPEMDDGDVLPLDTARAIFRQFSAYPHYVLYVAEQGGRIAGSYALLVMDNLGHLGAPSAIVEDVVVAPSAQSQGIGQAMMRHALAEARLSGCYKLMLSSNAKRNRAHAFYEALGFERHGYSFRIGLDGGEAE